MHISCPYICLDISSKQKQENEEERENISLSGLEESSSLSYRSKNSRSKYAHDSVNNRSFKNTENIPYRVKIEAGSKENDNSGYDLIDNNSRLSYNEHKGANEDSRNFNTLVIFIHFYQHR